MVLALFVAIIFDFKGSGDGHSGRTLRPSGMSILDVHCEELGHQHDYANVILCGRQSQQYECGLMGWSERQLN